MSKNQAGFWLVVAFLALPASAQEDLVTDRPDQTESSAVVPEGTIQMEAGILAGRDDGEAGERVELLEVSGTLVRYGLSPRLELRLAWPGWIRQESLGPTEGLQSMQRVALHGLADRWPRAVFGIQIEGFHESVARGLRGPDLGGRVLAFDADLRGRSRTVVAQLVPQHTGESALLLSLFGEESAITLFDSPELLADLRR